MKKNFALAMLLLCGTASLNAAPISKAEARLIAQQFVGISDTSSDNTDIAPYYVFSRGKGKGYVIVSGDDTTTPIIGYTEQGDFEDAIQVEPVKMMLDGWAERISTVQKQHIVGARRTVAQRLAEARRGVESYKANWKDVPALVQTHWSQSSPYNDMAPVRSNGLHCATGCVATAGSQIAYYFHKDNPNELQYSTPTYGYGVAVTTSLPKGTPIEWNKMKLSGSGTAEQNKAVATLVFALGASAGLTYGESTSGHNYRAGYWNMADALKGQFNINFKYMGKWQASQQAWEELIYSNLKTKRPMLYSGVHPSQGGHSVVLDGYQASTGLFHFNFGWGGQADGWYTVDDATGMNGFKDSQDLVYDFTPMYPKREAQMSVGTIYHRAPNEIKVSVENNGTLDIEGLYLYTATGKTLPQNATLSNKTVIESGKKAEVVFTLTPTQKSLKYLFLCDESRNILDSCVISVTNTTSALSLNDIHVDAGTESTVVDDITFKVVNNTTARVNVSLTNGEGGTYCRPIYECILESYNQENKTWKQVEKLNMTGPVFHEMETCDTLFSFTGLTPGTLYRAKLGANATTSTADPITVDAENAYAFFTVREANFQASVNGRQATVSGLWDATAFMEISSNKGICSFDITGLQQVDPSLLKAANRNALFYSSQERAELAGAPNVVMSGTCEQLVIYSDAEFKPTAAFKATNATFTVEGTKAGQWTGTLMPFATKAPYGVQMKKPTQQATTSVYYNYASEVEALTPVIFITGREETNTFSASNVAITTDTVCSLYDGFLQASTVNMPLLDNTMFMTEYLMLPYFMSDASRTQIDAFTPVVNKKTTRVTTSNETKADRAYHELCATIMQAFDAMKQNPAASPSAVDALNAALKEAEDLLTNHSTSVDSEVEATNANLKNAIENFLADVATGISSSENTIESRPVQYYGLSGMRLVQPQKGSIVIMRQGNKSKKVIIR